MLVDVLREWNGVEVSAMDVYSDIFHLGDGVIQRTGEPSGSFKANPIGYWKTGKAKGHYRIMFEDSFEEMLKEMQEADFSILNGITYFGRKNLQEHASKMYALIIDLDGVTDKTLHAFLYAAHSKDFDFYPIPNYIILSGHGVHLYYVFENGISLYPNIKLQMKAFKYALIDRVWNTYTSKDEKKQFQGINQGFRVIGGKTKIEGVRVRAFRLHQHPFSLEMLGKYIPEVSRVDEAKLWKESTMTLEEAKKKYPEWYQRRVVEKKPGRVWQCSDAVYEWWKGKIREGAAYHHRYFCIMCLAIYGVKCGKSYEEVEDDAFALIPFMNGIKPNEPFTKEDCLSALECFDIKYCTFPIDDIVKVSGIPIEKNKRNGRKQADHIKLMNFIRDEINHNDTWNKIGNGRPKGSSVAEPVIRDYLLKYPSASKKDIRDNTGMSYPTIRKYYDKIIQEINTVPSLDDMLQDAIEESCQRWIEGQEKKEKYENDKTDSG